MQNRKLFLMIVFVIPLCADLSIGQMETMVEKIKAKRVGKVDSNISLIESPFVQIKEEDNITVMVKEKTAEKEVGFILGAIVNNKAYLNKKWVKKGDSIEGYTLTDINDRSVSLVKGKHTVKVFLKKSKNILQVSEG